MGVHKSASNRGSTHRVVGRDQSNKPPSMVQNMRWLHLGLYGDFNCEKTLNFGPHGQFNVR